MNLNTDYRLAREKMVRGQLISRGIEDQRVLDAMAKIPRDRFVEEALSGEAYNDHPLPIGHKQTISQPYMVALMTEALGLTGSEKVLEIGTGQRISDGDSGTAGRKGLHGGADSGPHGQGPHPSGGTGM